MPAEAIFDQARGRILAEYPLLQLPELSSLCSWSLFAGLPVSRTVFPHVSRLLFSFSAGPCNAPGLQSTSEWGIASGWRGGGGGEEQGVTSRFKIAAAETTRHPARRCERSPQQSWLQSCIQVCGFGIISRICSRGKSNNGAEKPQN